MIMFVGKPKAVTQPKE